MMGNDGQELTKYLLFEVNDSKLEELSKAKQLPAEIPFLIGHTKEVASLNADKNKES